MARNRSRRYQHGSLRISPDGKRWIVKYYYAPGKQTTRTLGLRTEISRKQAEMMREELVRPQNLNPRAARKHETLRRFVEDVFFPLKVEYGEWRENTAKECKREIQRQILAELGALTFEELTAAQLRSVLMKKANSGLSRQTVDHLRFHLTDICKRAVAEGYLESNIAEGLKSPSKATRVGRKKLTVTMDQYVRSWNLLEERERLCFDLVMFAGMRESEVFGLRCGDVTDRGICIERSFYRGRFEAPKTRKSRREVGPDDRLLERLRSWISTLPANGPEDCVFPSLTVVSPIWPENALRNYIRPRLRPADLEWVNFAVLRRTHSTMHNHQNSDMRVIAEQQGHSLATHVDEYVQISIEEKKAASSKLYSEFVRVLHNQG